MQSDDDIGVGAISLMLGALILACLIGIIGLALSGLDTNVTSASSTTGESKPKGEALAKIYFEAGSANLPEEAGGAIQSIKENLLANAKLTILISGFHDPSGDPAKNAELAYLRADAARKALIEAGVSQERVILRKPELIPGTEDMQEARRVDIHLQ